MKLYYLSTSSFADCDINLLHHLAATYSITYGVVISKTNANYSVQQLSNYCTESRIKGDLFPINYRYRDPRTLFAYFRILRNIFRSKPDLIYINNFDHLYFNLAMLLVSNRKTVIAIHDVVSHSSTPFGRLAQFSRNLLLNKFGHFLTFSPSQAALLTKIRPSSNVYMIPLALKDFGTVTASTKPKNFTNFLFFGNIKPYKGLDILLKAVSRLSRKHTSFRLTVAGRCLDWDEVYEPLIENNSCVDKQIRFIDNDEIPAFFSTADYLILPYKDATQSGPLMIAYNYHIPVIASDIASFRDFISDGRTGYLFDPNTDEALYNVLEAALLRNEAQYNELRENVEAYARNHFAIENTINAYDALFKSITN